MQKRSSNQSVFYLLILAQGIVTFGLGIFGNKLSEIINVSPSLILGASVILIAISFAISIALLKDETPIPVNTQPIETRATDSPAQIDNKILPNRIVTIFPFSILCGAIVGFVCVKVIPPGPPYNLVFFNGVGPWYYELVAFFVTVLIIFWVYSARKDRALVMTFSLGYSISISSVFLLLGSDVPQLSPATVIGWIAATLITGWMTSSETIKGILKDIRNMLRDITKER